MSCRSFILFPIEIVTHMLERVADGEGESWNGATGVDRQTSFQTLSASKQENHYKCGT
jgi:hypothetical protein